MTLTTSILALISVGQAATLGPDLALTEITVTSDGKSVHATAEVTNLGDEDADEFRLDIFGNTSSQPKLGDKGDDGVTIYGLSSGKSVTVKLRMSALSAEPDGYANLWVLIDQLDTVAESNEDNNGTQAAIPNKVIAARSWGDIGWAYHPIESTKGECRKKYKPFCDQQQPMVCFDVISEVALVEATWGYFDPIPRDALIDNPEREIVIREKCIPALN